MQLYMSWYIRSFFGFTFLNILYFFKYSCTNIFHRRRLYTFYRKLYCGDKTVVRSSNLCNGISYTGKMASLYWFRPLVLYSLSGLVVRSREVSKLRDSRLAFSSSDFALLITLKFDRCLGSSIVDMPVKLQSDTTMVNLAASRLHEIWRYYRRLAVWPCCRLLRLRWRWGSHR